MDLQLLFPNNMTKHTFKDKEVEKIPPAPVNV